ncbi:hypothetical protein J7T55_008025 [Diaporthe amygdali]|uniref:uncharacterized protein n=1 Tax=Phomopsis amygdali TaxID=1214568 RepID=UPI0022FE0C01|nr:uncharacterized protein J7T55_008025 [Diaporthe amygdali]KAJ0114190.1 hypothetical protein J7T55_008025 [Diaporthe amygdali]
MLTKISFVFLPLAVSAGLLPSWLAMDRRTDICGVKGYDRNNGNYFWSASKKLTSYSGCSTRCAQSERCESFGFNDEACMLFDLSLAENFDADRHSDVKYYDVGCVKDATISTPKAASSLTRTTTVSSATRTVTRSIALATGTGVPLRPTNGTGFFPVTRTAASHSLITASSDEPATPTATADNSAAETTSSNSSEGDNSTESGSSGTGVESQIGDGILPPTRNITLANNGTSTALNSTAVFNSTSTDFPAVLVI